MYIQGVRHCHELNRSATNKASELKRRLQHAFNEKYIGNYVYNRSEAVL